MEVVFSFFPFVTCVKKSENQPNDFVESRRKSQPSPFQKVKAQTSASSLDNLVLSTTVKRLNGIIRTRMKEYL